MPTNEHGEELHEYTKGDINRIQGESYMTGQNAGMKTILTRLDKKAKELLADGIRVEPGSVTIPKEHQAATLTGLLSWAADEQKRIDKDDADRRARREAERDA
ncbi:hypothetical protein ACWGJ9_10580 [Curtobacterium citreum]